MRVWLSAAFSVCMFLLSIISARAEPTVPEQKIAVAEPHQNEYLPKQQVVVSRADELETLLKNQQFSQTELEEALHHALNVGDIEAISVLLSHYRQFPQTDHILLTFAEAQLAQKAGQHKQAVVLYRQILASQPELTPVRIQLATSLLALNHHNAAQAQFETVLGAQDLPEDIRALVNHYLNLIQQRNAWQFTASANYLRERNVNNASDAPYIENTAFKKNASMLPQKAHGVGYSFGLEREVNVVNSHFLHFSNELSGKYYWDKRDFDDISNRTYLGYVYKPSDGRFSLLPFYERQWYGGHRYKWSKGIRNNLNYRFSPDWQLSTALEYSQARYFSNANLNGTNKLASATLSWQVNPQRFLYVGLDVSRESTRIKQYGYDLKVLRLGWGEEWNWGISSRLILSYGKRDYKDNLALAGGSFRFDKARKDTIYQVNAMLWKREWHVFGITPKLNIRWKRQESNFRTLYAYRDRSVNLLFDKNF